MRTRVRLTLDDNTIVPSNADPIPQWAARCAQIESNTPNTITIKPDYKDVFGGTFSLGFIPKLKTVINPFIEISYHLDFTNSFSIPTNKIKNRALEFNVGIEF